MCAHARTAHAQHVDDDRGRSHPLPRRRRGTAGRARSRVRALGRVHAAARTGARRLLHGVRSRSPRAGKERRVARGPRDLGACGRARRLDGRGRTRPRRGRCKLIWLPDRHRPRRAPAGVRRTACPDRADDRSDPATGPPSARGGHARLDPRAVLAPCDRRARQCADRHPPVTRDGALRAARPYRRTPAAARAAGRRRLG